MSDFNDLKSDESDDGYLQFPLSQSSNFSIIDNLNREIKEKQNEIKILSSQSNKIINQENFFNGISFTNRQNAVNFIKNNYCSGKTIVNSRQKTGGRVINLKCDFKKCQFKICCKKGRTSPFIFDEASSCLEHGVIENNELVGFCTGRDRLSKV